MKILSVLKATNPQQLGGMETFNRMLKKIFQDELYFFSQPVTRGSYFEVDNIIEFKANSFYNKILKKLFGRNFPIKKELEKQKADVYILNQFGDFKLVKDIEKPCILVQHTNFENFFDINKDKEKIKYSKEKLDYFVFLSERDKERFIREIDFPREKSIVIRHSCELDLLSKQKVRNNNLIMLCRLNNKAKRIDLAINAMKKLEDYTLNIYGDGEDKEFLENIVKEKELKNVFLHGGTSQVKEKLDENGIFIMASDYEGYPITAIEAMRRGLPLILRNTFDSVPDIVQNNGILLDEKWDEDKFVEAVNKVYDNYEYYSRNSIEMGRRYDFEVISKKWKQLLNKYRKN